METRVGKLVIAVPTGESLSKRISQALRKINTLRTNDTLNPDSYWKKRAEETVCSIVLNCYAYIT